MSISHWVNIYPYSYDIDSIEIMVTKVDTVPKKGLGCDWDPNYCIQIAIQFWSLMIWLLLNLHSEENNLHQIYQESTLWIYKVLNNDIETKS